MVLSSTFLGAIPRVSLARCSAASVLTVGDSPVRTFSMVCLIWSLSWFLDMWSPCACAGLGNETIHADAIRAQQNPNLCFSILVSLAFTLGPSKFEQRAVSLFWSEALD